MSNDQLLNDQTVLFDLYIEPYQVLSLGQSRHGSYGNEGVLRIPQSPSITGASQSDYLM